jgi:hypothetical protein
MAALKQIKIEVKGARDLALISSDDSVWLVVPLRWWDLSTLLFWFFLPVDKKADIDIQTTSGEKVAVKAVRVAKRHIKVRGFHEK